MARRLVIALGLGSILFASLGAGTVANGASPPSPVVSAVEPYVPGLGDFMTAYVQPHHIKLWLAASVGNWDLAAYEANELGETFEDISTYQGIWKSVPVARLIKAIIEPALKNVDAAINAKNMDAFKPAYEALTAACNSCHTKAQHGFLIIRVPTGDPFSDQSFARH
jgi:hypothetical protein